MDLKLSAFVRIGSILYGIVQFSGLVDALLEPRETLEYVYGGLLNDITRYVDLPVLLLWYIIFVPFWGLLLVAGAVLKNSKIIEIYLVMSYFSFLMSLPMTFTAISFANVYSIQRARELIWTVFWLAMIHAMVKSWKRKNFKQHDDEIDEILE
ncbi:uncharacterized protein LOC134830767 [Culicoides brevitarsis]|uniref:uncharacterized protein LOC134830767 n=1 Tax=Culicoides brevitarsis TaxID=469753 RepID=UPI00307C46DE